MSFIKKQGVCGWIVVAAAIFALVSMIMYIVNSNTGYMEGMGMNALPVVFTVIFIIGAVIVLALSDKMNESLSGLLLFVLALLVAGSALVFIVERVDVIGDMLNPVNHPDAQVKAVREAIAGISIYLVAFVAMVIATIGGRLAKKEE